MLQTDDIPSTQVALEILRSNLGSRLLQLLVAISSAVLVLAGGILLTGYLGLFSGTLDWMHSHPILMIIGGLLVWGGATWYIFQARFAKEWGLLRRKGDLVLMAGSTVPMSVAGKCVNRVKDISLFGEHKVHAIDNGFDRMSTLDT